MFYVIITARVVSTKIGCGVKEDAVAVGYRRKLLTCQKKWTGEAGLSGVHSILRMVYVMPKPYNAAGRPMNRCSLPDRQVSASDIAFES